MNVAIAVTAVFCLAISPGWATGKPNDAHAAAGKAAPTCAALAFRPLPAGATDGEQSAGMYHSRFARLELRASVQNGAPANYYIMAGGTRIAAASGIPEAVANCATLKKMPKPQATADSCTGDRFTMIVAHADDRRYALLYAATAGHWEFCSAGTF